MTARDALRHMFAADDALAEAESRFLDDDREAIGALLVEEVGVAAALDDRPIAVRRLRRLADLAAQVEGPNPVAALLAILGHADPTARVEAGEALRDVAYERFKEVAVAIEAKLDAGDTGLAMEELPFVLIELRDPDPMPLLVRFLGSGRAEVVAATIEALVDFGDPAAKAHLETLVDDPREVKLEDLDDEPVSIGDLAQDALQQL